MVYQLIWNIYNTLNAYKVIYFNDSSLGFFNIEVTLASN